MEDKAKLWAARMDEWKRSGVTQRQFCEDNHLVLATFSWWRKRLKRQPVSTSSFIEIPRERSPSTSQGQIQITIGTYTVSVIGTVDPLRLETVLSVLERR